MFNGDINLAFDLLSNKASTDLLAGLVILALLILSVGRCREEL